MMTMKGLLPTLFCTLLVTFANAADVPKVVNFVTDQEKEDGFLIEISKEAFRRVGYTVNIQYMPWARALQTVMGGHAEALLGAYFTDERAEKMQYTNSIGASEIVFFKLRDADITYSRLEDLRPYRIGTIIGASYTTEFDKATFVEKEPTSDYNINLRKLLAGRVPLIVEKKAVILNALAIRYPESANKVVALDKPLKTGKFFNAFSKKFPGHQQKVADFNKGLDLLVRDGTMQKIMAKNMHE